LKHHDQIADVGFRQFHPVGENIERRAQRPDHRHNVSRSVPTTRLPTTTG
jgi:hypothetical protein